jgi:hypothetical protein
MLQFETHRALFSQPIIILHISLLSRYFFPRCIFSPENLMNARPIYINLYFNGFIMHSTLSWVFNHNIITEHRWWSFEVGGRKRRQTLKFTPWRILIKSNVFHRGANLTKKKILLSLHVHNNFALYKVFSWHRWL